MDKPLPVTLSTLVAKLVVTSAALALVAKLVVTSAVFALVASCVVVANPLRSWSPVLVPVIASSLFFSAVV